MEIFLQSKCKLYLRYLLKDNVLHTKFLNCLISIATSQELAGGEFISLYKRHRSSIEVHIFRRSGEQFLQFALESLKSIIGEMGVKVLSLTGENFIMDLLQQSLSVLGPERISQIFGNVEAGVLRALGTGERQRQNEAMHDVLVLIGASGR